MMAIQFTDNNNTPLCPLCTRLDLNSPLCDFDVFQLADNSTLCPVHDQEVNMLLEDGADSLELTISPTPLASQDEDILVPDSDELDCLFLRTR